MDGQYDRHGVHLGQASSISKKTSSGYLFDTALPYII
jgi:hypothetical protein